VVDQKQLGAVKLFCSAYIRRRSLGLTRGLTPSPIPSPPALKLFEVL
jgi:hypothetical protein